MSLKLDLSRAYDRVEWSFLERMMWRMRFGEIWIKIVMQCITSISFSIMINGEPKGNIKPTRGLR